VFISVDGLDGAGKTTQIDLLCQALENDGHQVARFRDPGTTKLGEAIRDILLHREEIPLSSVAEMLLYMASRAQLVREQIQPSLEKGMTIVCDRYLLANVVYQGSAGGISTETIWSVGQIATGGLMPDKTIVLDIEPEIAFQRIQRGHDRLEKRGLDYFRAVRQGFLVESKRMGDSCSIVNAVNSIDVIHAEIMSFLKS
jgi:dTMP kinase